MNARQLKYAYLNKSEVYSSDDKYPVKQGIVGEIIYTLTRSGKIRTDGVIVDTDNPKSYNPVRCRNVNFINENEIKESKGYIGGAATPHTISIQEAFRRGEPVIYLENGAEPIEYKNISAIVIRRETIAGKEYHRCSCILYDMTHESSTLRARIGCVFTPEELGKKKAAAES